ncbi:YaeQ family protein [Pseudoalteromonas xiamenensis]|uniref:YaeQ family protein n=1 Tax=Pseudoalteromonas xiamenensis TaxID=882626 RepID=UPI0035E9E87E
MNPFVCKARINIADLFHHVNHLESFTTAVGRRESLTHFVLKLVGYCALSYLPHTHWKKDEFKPMPDVWLENEVGDVLVGVFCDNLELSEMIKYAKVYDKVVMLQVKEAVHIDLASLQHVHNLSIFLLEAEFIERLSESITQSLHWDVVIDNGLIAVSNKSDYFESQIYKLK